MSEFTTVFNNHTTPSNSCWRRHCDQNTDDCAINPSSQMKSEVRQFFNIENDEEILFIRDTSFWNERNQGTVITDKYYYLVPDNDKPSEGVFFAWRDIQQVTYNDATIYFWQNDNINEAYSIHVSWFLKDSDESLYGYYGRDIANILNECVKSAVDPVKDAWHRMSAMYDKEEDPRKRISIVEQMQAQIPPDSWAMATGYVLIGQSYRDLKNWKNALDSLYKALNPETTEYGSILYGEVCYLIESIIDLNVEPKGNAEYCAARQYALMAARFADNEEKHTVSNGGESTSREDALVDFHRCDKVYTEHFLDIPYKDRKTLLVVNKFDNLFQDHFVTLDIDSDLSKLSFPTGHPKVNEVYVAHPLTTNRYMPIEDYQLELIEDRVREFCELAQVLGATEINIECLNSTSDDSTNSGNRNMSGGASRNGNSIHGSGHNEYSRRLIEEISRSISLHQTFQPHKAPALPDNLVWYNGEPSWQRLYRQRMEGGLLTHEERIETKKSQVVDNREMKEIKGELETLFANMNVAFDKTEEAKFEQQENAVLAISVKFAPLSQLTGEASSQQTAMYTANEQKYIDEVKECLADGEITKTGRRLLNMQRERLGLSESRAAELEASVSTPQLTDEEKEYLEAYREACEDGQISDKEHRMLNRLRDMLGISEERAKEIEKQ